ncbi:Cytochrome P450 monooxygenase [Lasiodiplodia hormozganensis]|uniref:Cytochrome P450 monooxygenase n=1 Tax=Lasiodiplodia hormozganensis TaxID=869390 RepID=A0AA40CNT2_9PEZI|nr:Cytochrome P450 monooxygenase [Lasiodiplodia hormozganensis]
MALSQPRSVADPHAFKEIYRAGGKFIKSELYGVVKGKRKFDLSGERDEAIHGAQRRLVARAYTKDSMRTLQASVDVLIVNFMKKLEQFDGKSVSLGYWLQLFAFDAIGAVSFSRSFGYVKAGNDNGLFARLRNSLKSISWLQHAPWIIYMHNAMMPLIGNWLAFNDRNVYFFEFAKAEVAQRKEQGGHNKDIVGQMLATQKEKPELDDTSMAFMMTTNVFAGSDTTATSLRAVILMLLRHPAAYRRLVDELDEKRAKGELSDPVTLEESEAWPYLQGVLYEGLRLYPAVGSSLPRVVPQGGMNIGDHYVPPGVSLQSD